MALGVDLCQFCCDSVFIKIEKKSFQKYSVALGVAPNAPTFSAVAAPLHPPAVPNLSGIRNIEKPWC